MESQFTLKATDKEAQALYDCTLATVKFMEFKGDRSQFPDMDLSCPEVHKWKVTLRHPDEIGEIKGTLAYNNLMKLLTK